VEEIDLKVKALDTDEIVNFRQHIGGGYFVSVTSGFFCVDFRKFFVPHGQHDVKPTRKGIALRLYEWADMRKVIEDINTDYPDIGTALPCSVQDDTTINYRHSTAENATHSAQTSEQCIIVRRSSSCF